MCCCMYLCVELELLLSCGDKMVKYTFVVDAAVIYTKVERFKLSLRTRHAAAAAITTISTHHPRITVKTATNDTREILNMIK